MSWMVRGESSGPRYWAYWANPTAPVATESGAVKKIIQTNRNDISWPIFCGP